MLLMTHSTDTTFLNIENAAHGGAFGKNPIPEPTEAQCKSGNYKMGRVSFQGLSIAIEQPRGTYRTGIDAKTGKRWTSRMAAHYGYISQTKGNDGDGVDCFVGPYPQSETAYAINQYIDGRFDEHKIMLAFPDEETARNAYLHSYERGWKGLKSIVPLSINQLKWWLKHGNKSQPIKSENLPPEGLEAMTRKVHWDESAQPYNTTIDQVLYEIRQSDSGENLLLDAVSIDEIIADSDGVLALDALVTPYIKLQRKMEILHGVMERMGTGIKPVAMQITEPFKQFGVANVAVVYELSDGQTVSIYFHNPDVTPNKMAPNDDVISYKWALNKKDITLVVAPERGQDLNIREVARRILKLAEKNSPAFARANAKRADRMQNIQSLKDEIVVLEGELKSAQNELEIAKVAAEDRKPEDAKPILPETDFNVDITSLNEALPGLNDFGISSLIIRTNGDINAVSVHDIKNSGVTDADILAAYGKGLLREATSSISDPSGGGDDGELEYNPDSGNPLVFVSAEYKYLENGWSGSNKTLEFTAPDAPEKFGKMDDYIKNLANISGISSLGEIVYNKEEYAYRGVSKKGIKHMGSVLLKGDDGNVYVRITLSINNSPTGGVVSKSYGGDPVHSLSQFIEALYQSAITAKFDKPMPEAMKIIARISGRDQDQPMPEDTFNPASPEDYAKIMADSELQLKYQDDLDALFQERFVGVRKALRGLGWGEQKPGEISKGNVIANFDFKHVGAGRNIVGMFIGLIDKTTDVEMEWNVKDDLTKTPEQLAAEINSAAPAEAIADSTQEQIKSAALWKGATMKVAAMLGGDKKASLELSRMTTKGDLDSYLMRKFGIDDTAARDISNTLTAQNIPADMAANLDDYKDEPWYSLISAASEIEAESEDMKAAREFLKSVVAGDKDKDDLMALLDKIEASANAIIEAGKGEEFDALIGGAAEKWAELDKQANG